jgi:hypothetical protein
MFHEIIQTAGGLQLQVEGAEVATIRDRHGSTDLVWSIRGPQDIDRARTMIVGLIDLLIQFDSVALKRPVTKMTKTERERAKSING